MALKEAKSPLATKAHQPAWVRYCCYEAWHSHIPKKGLKFEDALLILLHQKFGRKVSSQATMADSAFRLYSAMGSHSHLNLSAAE